MKKFLSLALALVMTMSLVTVSAGAKDFTDKSKIAYDEAVDVVSAAGIIDGYKDGSFNPQNTLTRGAAAKIICNLILGPTTASALHADAAPFKDVPTNHTFAGYIAYCAQQGIISGYADGTFRPGATLTSYAFMKMLLGALGYDSTIEGYVGPNWSIQVAKQAMACGLADGLAEDFNGIKAVTREEACLYAFNTLQTTMVEYDSKTTVNVAGATVTIAGDKAKEVAQGSYDNNMNAVNLQFAEKYFDKLKKSETTDDFARPATKWTIKGDKIGTYADKADVVYTDNTKLGTIYADLGMSQKDAKAEVFFNGVAAADVVVSKNNDTKIASDNANKNLVGAGSDVEVFYDEDNNDVRICVIDTYIGSVASKNGKVADPYIVINADSVMKDKANAPFTITGNKTHYETDVANFAEEDVVLFTYSQSADAIKSVVAAESVEGTLDKYTIGKKLTLGTTEYKYAKNIAFLFGNEDDMTTKNDYIAYLDANGLVIGVDEKEFDASKYAFVLYVNSSNTKFGKDQAQLILSNGTVKTVDTDDNYSDLDKTIVYYREDANGEYALRKAANVAANGTIAEVAPPNGTDGVISGGSQSFSMQNTMAKITTGTGTVYGNSNSVFVVAETDTHGKTTYSTYTGIKNVPTIMSNSPAGVTPAVSNKPVEMVYTTSGNVVNFAFIDATGAHITNGKRDVVFLAGASVSKRTIASDGTAYYTYNAVVDGEITTVKVKDIQDAGSGVNAGSKANQVVTNAQYTNKNLLKDATTTLTGYTMLTSSAGNYGVWKLSGTYTIGLGASKDRETVATDAKMFIIDVDGNITKVDDVKDITSDSTAEFIALRDIADGDIDYLFVQQVDNGKHEDAVSGGVVNGISLANNGVVTVSASAPVAVNTTVKVTLSQLRDTGYIEVGTYKITIAASTSSATKDLSAYMRSGETYQVACNGETSQVVKA